MQQSISFGRSTNQKMLWVFLGLVTLNFLGLYLNYLDTRAAQAAVQQIHVTAEKRLDLMRTVKLGLAPSTVALKVEQQQQSAHAQSILNAIAQYREMGLLKDEAATLTQAEQMANQLLQPNVNLEQWAQQYQTDQVSQNMVAWHHILTENEFAGLSTTFNQEMNNIVWLFASVLSVILLFTAWVYYQFIYRGLVRPLNDMQSMILASEFVHHTPTDEAKRALRKKGGSAEANLTYFYLEHLMKEVQASTNEKQAMQEVIRTGPANVMLADNDLHITFMSESVMQVLKEVEPQIQKTVPHFKADNLIGKNIDIFHQAPERIRSMLLQLTSPYTANLNFDGGLSFKIVVTPVFDHHGQRIGFSTDWVNVSSVKELERMQDAVESSLKLMVQKASRGHIGETIELSHLDGFIHDLGEQINDMSVAIYDANMNISKVISKLSEGDLTQRIEGNYEAVFGDIQQNINDTLDSLSGINANVIATAEHISQMMAENSQLSSDFSARMQQQAASIEQTAATMEQMTTSVRTSADNASAVTELTSEVIEKASNGQKVMADTLQAMRRIRGSSEKIEQIIDLIDSIAFQTNLLALNAAVEAARAGEHGRGFAVVAQEVRALAGKSSSAADEIKSLIELSVSEVQEGMKLAELSEESLTEITESIKTVTSRVREISESSSEQTAAIEQLNNAIVSIDSDIQESAQMVEESSNSISITAEKSQELLAQMKHFKVGEDKLQQARQSITQKVANGADIQTPARQTNLTVVKKAPTKVDTDESWSDF